MFKKHREGRGYGYRSETDGRDNTMHAREDVSGNRKWNNSGKKVAIIGSTQYRGRMQKHKDRLESEGATVRIPAFDDTKDMNELQICEYNLELIRWAEEVHLFWDQRSSGLVFDFGMAFALGKQVRPIYVERKTLANVMYMYSRKFLSK